MSYSSEQEIKKPKLWFKAKNYGYGWYPATWQGWAVLGLYLTYFTLKLVDFVKDISEVKGEPKGEIIGVYLLDVLVATIFLIIIAYLFLV